MERLGLACFEVERYEYDDDGEVIEHIVETWPDYHFVKDLPLDAEPGKVG